MVGDTFLVAASLELSGAAEAELRRLMARNAELDNRLALDSTISPLTKASGETGNAGPLARGFKKHLQSPKRCLSLGEKGLWP